MIKNAIIVMAKKPVPDQVKTRLTPPLDPEIASSLYFNFLLDKIEQIKNIEAQAFIAFTPAAGLSFFRCITPSKFILMDQVGRNLGERLINVSKNLFGQGFKKILILDSDSPNLPPEYILKGFTDLDDCDIVLGPCEDGGYYLIGLKASHPQLFWDIPWSTSDVTKLTLQKAQSLGLTISLLETWYDIDTIDDLQRLKSDLDSYTSDKKGIFFCENTYREICRMKKSN